VASFSSKLGRVDLRGFSPGAVPAAAPAAPGSAFPEPARAEPAPPPGAPPSLDELRDRIARILAKQPAPRPAPRLDPTVGELPFALEETPLGPLYVRTRRLSPSHRVGRVSVRAASTAAASMLALLALDPALAACEDFTDRYENIAIAG
jgi:hypothetical protein